MQCTLLANGERVGLATLTFVLPKGGEPFTVIGEGPLSPGPAFDERVEVYFPRRLVGLVSASGAAAAGIAPRRPWSERPAFTLLDARGHVLPTHDVLCAPARESPTGYLVTAYFDEAGAPSVAALAQPARGTPAHCRPPGADA